MTMNLGNRISETGDLRKQVTAGSAFVATRNDPIAAGETPRKQNDLIAQMLAAIARDLVPERPGRSEPRAKKRRAKNYQLLTQPRHKIGNLPCRNRPRKITPEHALA